MPKLKTRKCVAKRVKRTGTGKYRHFKTGRRHLMTGKGGKRKRHLKRDGEIKSTQLGVLKKALPYG
jgi:large subunit ribosomal protein L35